MKLIKDIWKNTWQEHELDGDGETEHPSKDDPLVKERP